MTFRVYSSRFYGALIDKTSTRASVLGLRVSSGYHEHLLLHVDLDHASMSARQTCSDCCSSEESRQRQDCPFFWKGKLY